MDDQTQTTGSQVERRLLSEAEFAGLIGKSVSTAQRLRYTGKGPRVCWINGFPNYRPEAIQAWLEEQERPPSARPPDQGVPRANGTPAPRSPTDVCKIPWCTALVQPRAGPGPRNKYCAEHLDINSRRRAAARAAP